MFLRYLGLFVFILNLNADFIADKEYENDGVRKNNTQTLSIKYNEEEILKEAKNKNKYILVYATAEKCYFCQQMEKEVLSLEEVKKAIDKNYIFLVIDILKNKLPFSLEKNYKRMTPTFFILSSEGEVLNRYPGAWDKADFLEILKENIE